MSPRFTLAALRNYARPVFWRENSYSLLVPLSLALFLSAYFGEINPFHVKNLHAAVDKIKNGKVSAFWWYICMLCPAALSAQYWRQITTSLAPNVPHLLRAEYNAALVVLGLCIVALAAPFMLIGAPVFGCLAIACVGTILGGILGSNGGRKGHSLRMRWVIAISMPPVALIGFVPGLIWRVLVAPYWIAVPTTFVSVVLICLVLRFFPAQALIQTSVLEQKIDQKQAKSAPRGPIKTQFVHLLLWRPKFLKQDVLPNTMAVQMGLLGQLLIMILIVVVGTGSSLLAALPKHGHILAWQPLLQGSLIYVGMFALAPLSSWMMMRQDWPFIYLAGRYGSRLGFAQALFRAQRRNALEISGLAAVVSLVVLLVSGLHVLQAIEGGVVLGTCIFGLSYTAALPLFWRELGGKGVTVAFMMIGIFGFQFLFMAYIIPPTRSPLWLALALAIAALGALVGYVAPKRLAKLDWPLETP